MDIEIFAKQAYNSEIVDIETAKSIIGEAESLRASGKKDNLRQARANVDPLIPQLIVQPSGTFNGLGLSLKVLAIEAARISVVSSGALAQKEGNVHTGAQEMGWARNLIVEFYRHPEVVAFARTVKKDHTGETDFDAYGEMRRDEFRYLLKLARLTGDPRYYIEAAEILDRVARIATEPSLKALARYDQAEAKFAGAFSSRGRFEAQQILDNCFAQVLLTCRHTRPERLATVASRYTVHSFNYGHWSQALRAYHLTQEAALEDPATKGIFWNEAGKASLGWVRTMQWRSQTLSPDEIASLQLK